MASSPGAVAGPDDHAEVFEQHRGTLLGAAYQVLGTVQDSEDVAQETWLRWQGVDLETVRDPRAFLLTIVTRTALNTVRARTRRREEYLGPWLPEPVSTDSASDPGRATEMADDVSLALLVVLESLSPLERAAFVLREVFGSPYSEVSATLDRSEASVRQLVSRARTHVRAQAPRRPADAAAHRDLPEALRGAAPGAGALAATSAVLAPHGVPTTDAGGRAKAPRRPVRRTDNVLRLHAGVLPKPVRAM